MSILTREDFMELAECFEQCSQAGNGLGAECFLAIERSHEALRAENNKLRAQVAEMREALGKIAKGASHYTSVGGFVCGYCGENGSEWCADRHRKDCPRTIARAALARNEGEK